MILIFSKYSFILMISCNFLTLFGSIISIDITGNGHTNHLLTKIRCKKMGQARCLSLWKSTTFIENLCLVFLEIKCVVNSLSRGNIILLSSTIASFGWKEEFYPIILMELKGQIFCLWCVYIYVLYWLFVSKSIGRMIFWIQSRLYMCSNSAVLAIWTLYQCGSHLIFNKMSVIEQHSNV